MSFVQRHIVSLTTASDGSATGYTPVLNGRLSAIHYVKNDFANGVDFTITNDSNGQSLWTESDVNASAIRAPRQPTHDGVGAASLYAAVGEPVEAQMCLANDRIKIVIAQGGSVKSGAFHFVLD